MVVNRFNLHRRTAPPLVVGGSEKLPGGEPRVRAARLTGTIDGFPHSLDGKVERKKPLSIDDINRIAAVGWAGKLDQA